jgi:hypothetical protein
MRKSSIQLGHEGFFNAYEDQLSKINAIMSKLKNLIPSAKQRVDTVVVMAVETLMVEVRVNRIKAR